MLFNWKCIECLLDCVNTVQAVTSHLEETLHHGPHGTLMTSQEKGGSHGKEGGEGQVPFRLILKYLQELKDIL